MQMVAASKMRRTQDKMAQGKPYSERVRGVIGHLANSNPEYKHIYMDEREIKRIGYIVVSTDRGLCGAFRCGRSVPRSDQRRGLCRSVAGRLRGLPGFRGDRGIRAAGL